MLTSATCVLSAKTDLMATYNYSRAGYGQNNGLDGVPLGLDFTRHELLVGLKHQFSKSVTGSLRYGFSQYTEPSANNADNFTAHGIFAALAYSWR